MFYQIFLSPQVKRWAIIAYKHGIYKLQHNKKNSKKKSAKIPLGRKNWCREHPEHQVKVSSGDSTPIWQKKLQKWTNILSWLSWLLSCWFFIFIFTMETDKSLDKSCINHLPIAAIFQLLLSISAVRRPYGDKALLRFLLWSTGCS